MSIETKLQQKYNLLKNNIENKFNTTTTSTTITGLISELNTLINKEIIPTPHSDDRSIAERIYSTGNYLAKVLQTANITASVTDGFTTLINKIDNIEINEPLTPITPTISISRTKSSISNDSTVTLIATITGDSEHGIPTGSVEFYEGNSNTPFHTVTTPSTTTESTRRFYTTITHTVSSTTAYTFYAKFISDNDNYTDTEKSDGVTVTWTYTAPTKSASRLSINATLNGIYITWNVTGGAGTVSVGTTSGGNDIATFTTSSSSGTINIQGYSGTSYNLYAKDTGDSNYYAGSDDVTVNLTH